MKRISLGRKLTETEKLLCKRFKFIKQRCYNSKHSRYKDYGGRGITICDEWLNDVSTFIEWAIQSGFKANLTIDRINNNEGYSPENCRWVPQTTQLQNTRKLYKTNKSGYRGVSWQKKMQKWEVSIGINKTTVKLGYYDDLLEAAKVYDTYIMENNLSHTLNGVVKTRTDKRLPNTNCVCISSNTSGYAGVVFVKRINKWFASVELQGKKHSLKYHSTAIKAALIRELFLHEQENIPYKVKLNFPNLAKEEIVDILNKLQAIQKPSS